MHTLLHRMLVQSNGYWGLWAMHIGRLGAKGIYLFGVYLFLFKDDVRLLRLSPATVWRIPLVYYYLDMKIPLAVCTTSALCTFSIFITFQTIKPAADASMSRHSERHHTQRSTHCITPAIKKPVVGPRLQGRNFRVSTLAQPCPSKAQLRSRRISRLSFLPSISKTSPSTQTRRHPISSWARAL
jgi:hypothetical protein